MDEKGWRFGIGMKRKRMVRWGSDKGYKEHTNRESCTIIETINPQGRYLTPVVIWKGVAGHLCGWYRSETKENYWYGTSPKGFNTQRLTIQYLKKNFDPETRPKYDSPLKFILQTHE